MSAFETIKEEAEKYILPTYSRFDIALDHGQGSILVDVNGKEYIDMTSGIGVVSLGQNHPQLAQAIAKQAQTLLSVSNLFYTEPMVEAAKLLVDHSGMEKVFFGNSGAEANEGAIKCARKYAADRYGPDRYKILTLTNSFHGRTIATLEATGQDHFHQNFFPFTEGFDYIPANDIEALKDKLDDSVCAVMVELIQGESGVRPLDPTYVKELEKLCKEKDVLLIVDEVQTGIGRTGKLFCYQNYGIEPDLVTFAKGAAGGVPIGGFLTGKKTTPVLKAGDHGSTFGANPLAAAAAKTVLSIVTEPEFLNEVVRKGNELHSLLEKIDSQNVLEVRGMGLMQGIQVPQDRLAGYIKQIMDKGVLVLKAGSDTIRLLPPLTISSEEIKKAAQVIREVLEA